MGLAEKKAIRDLVEMDLPKRQEIVHKNGAKFLFMVDLESFPQEGTEAPTRAGYVAREFCDQVYQFAQDAMAKDELNSQIDTVKIRHDGSMMNDYDYTLKKEGRSFVFSANLNIFTMGGSKQECFAKAMTKLL